MSDPLSFEHNESIQAHFEYIYPHGDKLLAMGWCTALAEEAANLEVVLGMDGNEYSFLFSDCIRYPRPDVAHQVDKAEADYGFIATFSLQDPAPEVVGLSLCERAEGDLLFDDEPITFAILQLDKAPVEELIGNNWSQWSTLLERLSKTPAMQEALTALRSRFDPLSLAPPPATWLQLNVDLAARIGETGLVLAGWALSFHDHQPIDDLRLDIFDAASGQLETHCFLARAVRLPRVDVIDHFNLQGSRVQKVGFACYFEGLSLTSDSGETLQMQVAAISGDAEKRTSFDIADYRGTPIALSQQLFALFSLKHVALRKLLNEHIGVALASNWQTFIASGRLDTNNTEHQRFGQAINSPDVSLIIPLYGRYDFVEYQLSQFALDPYMHQVDIIYVNDDPGIQDDLLRLCYGLAEVYQLSFSLLHAGKNLGYAGANNLAASYAIADTLLLLNSDVLPKRTGWLKDMLTLYMDLPNAGAMGARLLYEDGSLQHDGATFNRYPYFDNMWICEHPGKGLAPQLLPAVSPIRKVDAVTGACLMISKARYFGVGGLDNRYVIGDFEDSDLCLHLREQGYLTYQASNIELFHLERQSQGDAADYRAKLTAYNCWLHHERWDNTISAMKALQETPSTQPASLSEIKQSAATTPTRQNIATNSPQGGNL